jgi:hypothetical protein
MKIKNAQAKKKMVDFMVLRLNYLQKKRSPAGISYRAP